MIAFTTIAIFGCTSGVRSKTRGQCNQKAKQKIMINYCAYSVLHLWCTPMPMPFKGTRAQGQARSKCNTISFLLLYIFDHRSQEMKWCGVLLFCIFFPICAICTTFGCNDCNDWTAQPKVIMPLHKVHKGHKQPMPMPLMTFGQRVCFIEICAILDCNRFQKQAKQGLLRTLHLLS